MTSARQSLLAASALTALSVSAPALAQTAAPPAASTAAPAPTTAAASPTLYPRKAIGVGPAVGGDARWAEDGSSFRDSSGRDDSLDRLKYLPLTPGGDIWLSLSGEMRVRMDYTTSPDLTDGPDERLDTLRLVGGADLRVGPHLRFYGELSHGSAGGENIGNPVGVVRNDLAVTQAFVDVQGEIANLEVGARYGRQFFSDGSPHLISTRNGATLLTPFNGVRGWVRSEHWRADLFDFDYTSFGNGGWDDDRTNSARRFSGVTASLKLPRAWTGGSEVFLDPFIWRQENDNRRWGATVAPESRNYFGARLWGQSRGVTIDWAVARQTGDFGGREIDAWHGFSQQSIGLGEGPTAPRLGFRVDYASGGGAYDGGAMRNAVTPLGVPIFYSYQLALSPVNMIAVAPSISLRRGATTYKAEVQGVWRASRRDAVYRFTDLPYAGTQLIDDRRVGEMWRFEVAHRLTPRASLLARYEHLAAGPALTKAGYESSDHFIAWLNYRF